MFPYAQHFTVYLMDLLFNQVEIFYNNILAETSYHLLTSIYYKYSLNFAMSLVAKYYQGNHIMAHMIAKLYLVADV
jgi:hypothetical protein